jgi:alpha-tubulin suppressor-like RCC1 family protein
VENNTTYNFTANASDVELQNITKQFSVDITPNFTLWGMGSNSGLGFLFAPYGTAGTRSSPVQLGGTPIWTDITQGYQSLRARKYDGTLWAWGSNNGGKLGINNRSDQSSPVQIGSGSEWNISSNFKNRVSASFVIKNNGTLWAIGGTNANGQLGQNHRLDRSSPTQVGTGTDWVKVSNVDGAFGACAALKSDGTLWTWGQNNDGQIGQNDRVYRSSPTQIGSAEWSDVLITATAFLAIKTNGTLWSCGNNNDGHFGTTDTTATIRSSPVQVGVATNWSKLFGHGGNNPPVAAIKTDGTLWAWGRGSEGQLGGNSSPGQTSIPAAVGSDTNWSKIAIGYQHMIAIKTDGTLWAWGQNSDGQLGTGDRISRSSPVQVGTNTNWYDISSNLGIAGTYVNYAISRN